MYIDSQFDSGNIKVKSNLQSGDVLLEINSDNQSDYAQWFHFSATAETGTQRRFSIQGLEQSAYPEGWKDYNVAISYDREYWIRLPSTYDGNNLTFDLRFDTNTIYVAYFAPYSWERHLDLISFAQNSHNTEVEVLGMSLDKRPLHLLHIGQQNAHHHIWITARQHPGETMAEYFVEGLLSALLDPSNATAQTLLKHACLHIVPNMNPDGSVRGHLRTNAIGVNLNREWATPSIEKSPEVFYVREKMLEIGGDVFLDIHGDEAIPYNFAAGAEGIPSYSDDIAALEHHFKTEFCRSTPDFQVGHGYEIDKPGQANMTVGSNWMAEQFKTLALTIEMPFKDHNDVPNTLTGWSPDRSRELGRSALSPLLSTLQFIQEK